jgi:hypothetical protein
MTNSRTLVETRPRGARGRAPSPDCTRVPPIGPLKICVICEISPRRVSGLRILTSSDLINLRSQSKRLQQPKPNLTDRGIRRHGMPKSIEGDGSDNRDRGGVEQFARRWSY